MDRLGTWEVPFTSTCERTGSLGRRLNNGPGPEVPSDLLGAQVAKHEARRIAWTPEAKQISDRICVAWNWPPAMPRYRPHRTSLGRRPILRGPCALSLASERLTCALCGAPAGRPISSRAAF